MEPEPAARDDYSGVHRSPLASPLRVTSASLPPMPWRLPSIFIVTTDLGGVSILAFVLPFSRLDPSST